VSAVTERLLADIVAAWTIEGPHPPVHRRAVTHLRDTWPKLARALDAAAQHAIDAEAAELAYAERTRREGDPRYEALKPENIPAGGYGTCGEPAASSCGWGFPPSCGVHGTQAVRAAHRMEPLYPS
jgi:hypothetical protein